LREKFFDYHTPEIVHNRKGAKRAVKEEELLPAQDSPVKPPSLVMQVSPVKPAVRKAKKAVPKKIAKA
jgi:hypothetical protein